MTRRLHAVVPQAAGAASCGGREPLRPGERGQLDAGGGTVIEAFTTLPVFVLVDADAQAPSFAGGTR
jgi:hypothetical protein